MNKAQQLTEDLMDVIKDALRIHDITITDEIEEELRLDIEDTIEWEIVLEMSNMLGGRI